MEKLVKHEFQELTPKAVEQISGGGFLQGTQSLFRSAMYFGVRAYDTALTALGILAGLGDGIEAGLQKDN